MVEIASVIWADGPSSQPYQPSKEQIRAWGTWIEGIISAFTSNGGLIYTTRALLNADLARGANSMAWVVGDPVVSNNGVYGKVGGIGFGYWVRRADLPYSFIIAEASGAGTANTIQATSPLPISGSALVLLSVYQDNTGSPVTISFNGSAPMVVKSNSGNDIVAGGLKAGMVVLGRAIGSVFRLVSDQASAAILAAAEEAAVVAESAAGANLANSDSRAAAILTNIPAPVNYVRTAGYSTAGDGGGALYKRSLVQPAHAGKFQSADGAWWEIAERNPAIRMFGVTGSGSDESSLFNGAISYAASKRIREIYVSDGVYRANTLSNPNGVKLVGPGVVNTGSVKYNSTGDFFDSHFDGLEYLWNVHTKLVAQGTVNKTVLFGDSTVYGAYIGMAGSRLPAYAQPQNILQRIADQNGAVSSQVINSGVNGTTVADLDYAAHISDPAVGCFVIKYMINDASFSPAGDSVETFATNLRGKLAAIRAVKNVGNLSIILVTGNSANSGGSNPDLGNQWFEKAIPVLRRAARDYQCAFVDVYSPFRDNYNAANWMDVTDTGINHTHPGIMMQHWIWDRVGQILFNRTVLSITSLPVALTLSNGWVNYAGTTQTAQVYKKDGWVCVEGLIKSGTTTVGTIVTQLPLGYRPLNTLFINCATNAGTVKWRVEPDGGIYILSGADTQWSDLSGIKFRAWST